MTQPRPIPSRLFAEIVSARRHGTATELDNQVFELAATDLVRASEEANYGRSE